MLLSYKRILQMFNWNEKNLLKEKAEEPIAELSDVPLPSSMSCEDELGLEIDPYIFLSSSSIPNPIDESHIEASLKLVGLGICV